MDKKKVITGLAAAAAGIYVFLNDEESKPIREKTKPWMLKAKSEIADKLEKTEEVSEEKYHEIVSEVMSKYEEVKEKDEVEEMIRLFKKNWKKMLARAAVGAATTMASKKYLDKEK